MDAWVPGAVNYQVNLRSLAAREPRNAIEAAAEQEIETSPISYLTRNLVVIGGLGVNVLHLMPPFSMGEKHRKGIGSPYVVRDYLNVDPEYGTLNELKACIRAAHLQGIRLILGMVPNHSSRDHAWIAQQPEYYVRGEDGAPAYDQDRSDTARLDYSQPGLRRAMVDVFEYWLSLLGQGDDGVVQGVDGFLIDKAHLINDRSFWDEAISELRARHPNREILFMTAGHGMQDSLDLFARGFNAAYDDDFYKVCLYLYGVDASGQTCLLESPEASTDSTFAPIYAAYRDRGIAGAMEAVLTGYEEQLADGPGDPRLARYTDNHDEGRGVYRFGDGATLAVNQLIFLCGRTMPSLLTGQEFGAENRPSIHTRIGVCDPCRNVRHGDTVHRVPAIEFEGNLFARGRMRRKGWYSFYQDLIALRHQLPELSHGSFRLVEAGEDCAQSRRTVIAFERRYREHILRCAVNLGTETRQLKHNSLFRYAPLYGGLIGNTLPPFTSVVVRCT